MNILGIFFLLSVKNSVADTKLLRGPKVNHTEGSLDGDLLLPFDDGNLILPPNDILPNDSRRKLSTSDCEQKRVRVYKFCINGDDDSGAHGEHQIKLDGERYYPQGGSDCPQDPSGYCNWREGQCHNLHNAKWYEAIPYRSLTVGTEEHDTSSENDSYLAYLTPKDWYNKQCKPYEVIFSVDFDSATKKSVCWNVAGGASGKGAEINAGIESCSEWTEPAESYVWFMEVEPVKNYQVLVHIQDYGDRTFDLSEWAGFQNRRLEGFEIKTPQGMTVEYMAHLQDYGDTSWTSGFVGSRGQGRRLEGFAIRIKGALAKSWSVVYFAYLQGTGSTSRCKDGQFCGTRGQHRQVEAMYVTFERKN